MTQLHLETDLAEAFVQVTFITSILFGVTYGFLFDWRSTVTGRSIMLLDLAIFAALLRSVFIVWGVDVILLSPRAPHGLPFSLFDIVLSWFSVVGLGLAGLCLFILMWQCIRYKLAEAERSSYITDKIFFLRTNEEEDEDKQVF